jgi:hypothetical protein
MTSGLRPGRSWLAASVGMAIAVGVLVAAVPGSAANKPCCFNNARYSGTCSVIPGKDETCQGILSYLNNPNSTGRSYCGGTTIRGEWNKVECTTGKVQAQSSAAGISASRQRNTPAQP